MGEGLFKIVFRGEIGFDYDRQEVMENLQTHCGFAPQAVERLFSGGAFVLKKDLDEETANRYREFLHRLGALCEIAPTGAGASCAAPTSTPSAAATTFSCPACGHGQEKEEACSACGIVFAKYDRLQARMAQGPCAASGVTPASKAGEPAGPGRATGGRRGDAETDRAAPAATRPVLQGCALTILAAALLQTLLGSDLMILGFVLFPFAFLIFLLVRVLVSGRDLADLLAEYVTIESVGPAKGEARERLPWVTCALILLNLLIYYGLTLPFGTDTLADNFAFPPRSPNFWNVPLSVFAAPLLHGSGWQLWGGAVLLWGVGGMVEKRIGPARFLACYLLAALLAGGAGAAAHRLLLHVPYHGIGASGAIAGLLGIVAACCPGHGMRFPFSVPGKVPAVGFVARLDFLLVVGLFFYASLAGGIDRGAGWAAEVVGHMVNLGGLLGGMVLGLIFDVTRIDDGAGTVRTRASCGTAGD